MGMLQTLLAAFIAGVLLATPAAAETQSERCLTKPGALGKAVTAKDALQWPRAEAATTDSDSTLTRMLTTGSVDAKGRSTGWMLELISSSGKRLHVVRFDAGAMTCMRQALERPLMVLPVNESAETILDLARLIGIARDASNPPPDLKVLKVSAGLQRSDADGAALWSISFVDAAGYPKAQVTIDSMTGAVVSKMPR